MFKHRKMRFNGEWSLLAGNRVYELNGEKFLIIQTNYHLLFNKNESHLQSL